MAAAEELTIISSSKLKRLEVIGEGGFGTVYKCAHHDWGYVAVKKLKAENINQLFSKKLREEANIQSKLRHANITQMIGLIWEPSYYAVVMEYMRHGSLDQFIELYTPVPWGLKLQMIHDILLGVNYLHTRKPAMIHQDLKIQNCLVGESFNIKISDFGLSEWMKYSQAHTNHSPKGGTVTHLPPERWKNINLQPNFKSDVYSFGILLWEVVSEKIPFDGSNDAQISHAVCNGQRPNTDPEHIPPSTPPPVIQMMTDCWKQDPQTRPAFGELKEKIEDYTAGLIGIIEGAKADLFRQISGSSLNSMNGSLSASLSPQPEKLDLSRRVQFRPDEEVYEISMLSPEESSCRGEGYHLGLSPPASVQPGHAEQRVPTNPQAPVQREGTVNETPARTNPAPPIQRIQTVERQPESAVPPYGNSPTVNLYNHQDSHMYVNGGTAQGSPTCPNNGASGPPTNIRMDGQAGIIDMTNVAGLAPTSGTRVVIHKTRSGDGCTVEERITVDGDGKGIQIGPSNVMHVVNNSGGRTTSTSSRPASTSSRQPSRSSKLVIRKTISVAAKPVDHNAMDVVSQNVGRSWRKLGRQLGFTDGQIDIFESNNRGLYEQIFQMLREWQQQTGPEATYKKLAECLVKIQKPDVALKLQASSS